MSAIPFQRSHGGEDVDPPTVISLTSVPRASRRAHHVGFWLTAAAFLVNMGFSAVPTPLYVLYQGRDHFSNLMVTIVYAVYAVGVVGSLFLAGHLSDWMGRRRIFVPALAANVVSALIFIFEPSLSGLIIARIISGISVGLTTATATSYLAELHATARPGASTDRAEIVATASNLGGIGFGPLVAGLLAQFAPAPLRLPFIVFGVLLVVLVAAVGFSPETVRRPDVQPAYRPQRIVVPAHARAIFFAATFAGMASFAVYGVFNSLVPSFLAGTLHEKSHAVAGAVAFAAFAAGALAQIAQRGVSNRNILRRSVPTVIIGLALLAAAMWVGNLGIFVIGGVITGTGAGLVFKGALVAAASTAPEGARAEVLAGFFLGAYVGLSIPVVGLGIATMYAPARDVMLVFVVLAAAAIAASVRPLVRAGGHVSSTEQIGQVSDIHEVGSQLDHCRTSDSTSNSMSPSKRRMQ
ncbi:MAG TPA: MFS transporter [Acidimicrobiales bacterium]|jgi:MFS family permease